jgi:hypothetical protein
MGCLAMQVKQATAEGKKSLLCTLVSAVSSFHASQQWLFSSSAPETSSTKRPQHIGLTNFHLQSS